MYFWLERGRITALKRKGLFERGIKGESYKEAVFLL